MKNSQWKPIVLFSCCEVAKMGNKNSVWVLLKRATTPTRLHLPPLSLTHPRTIYFQLPLPTNKKCPPTPIYPKYISTNPHSPRIYLHPPIPTPVTHKNVHSPQPTQNIKLHAFSIFFWTPLDRFVWSMKFIFERHVILAIRRRFK